MWTAAHGWVYLHVIIDCCTREIAAWTLDLRCRTDEAIACVDAGLLGRNMGAQRLTIGTDNGTQFTSRRFLRHLADHHISHRRGGYRDPESQAFIESWFGQFKKRVAWRAEWETIDQARRDITAYIDIYHHRPHSGLRYRTPAEVAQTWRTLNNSATRNQQPKRGPHQDDEWAIARRYMSLDSLAQTRIRLIEPDQPEEVTPALETATS